jgi:hypothetical protein
VYWSHIHLLFPLSPLTLHRCCPSVYPMLRLILSLCHTSIFPSFPLLFVCETSWLVTCPCFYVCPVSCLQPRKCATCLVCLMLTFSSDTTLRQSHFNGNMDDQRRQNFHYPTPLREDKVQHLVKNPSLFIDSNCFLPNPTPIMILR